MAQKAIARYTWQTGVWRYPRKVSEASAYLGQRAIPVKVCSPTAR